MRKLGKLLLISIALFCTFILGCLIADNQSLQENLIRLHVVANSDDTIDQENKLAVRDAVISYLEEKTAGIATVSEAKAFLEKNLTQIESVVNKKLETIGAQYRGKVTLAKEKFSKRVYDTFCLPSGIYNSLKIELGKGDGKNWWCVAFPALCFPKTEESFRGAAIEAGLQETLVDTISNDDYKIRFFLLDCLGKIENFLYF